jgi:hypothetical protein
VWGVAMDSHSAGPSKRISATALPMRLQKHLVNRSKAAILPTRTSSLLCQPNYRGSKISLMALTKTEAPGARKRRRQRLEDAELEGSKGVGG